MREIKLSTITRTVLLILALVNQVLTSVGKPVIQIDDETATELIANLFTIITALIAWWKNNSFTQEAIIADEEMREMKSAKNKEE